jgi:hypothetical protein|tara:strand:+ start:315 stop:677 length:363 start_codon:yes stop_codon:yes gene_type:complete
MRWVLDVSMSEDVCLIYNAHGAENLSCLHHMSLNMLGAEPTKISIVRKQKRCMMNPSMLKVVLKTGFSSSVTNKIALSPVLSAISLGHIYIVQSTYPAQVCISPVLCQGKDSLNSLIIVS